MKVFITWNLENHSYTMTVRSDSRTSMNSLKNWIRDNKRRIESWNIQAQEVSISLMVDKTIQEIIN